MRAQKQGKLKFCANFPPQREKRHVTFLFSQPFYCSMFSSVSMHKKREETLFIIKRIHEHIVRFGFPVATRATPADLRVTFLVQCIRMHMIMIKKSQYILAVHT